jgi:hypothetical protein
MLFDAGGTAKFFLAAGVVMAAIYANLEKFDLIPDLPY